MRSFYFMLAIALPVVLANPLKRQDAQTSPPPDSFGFISTSACSETSNPLECCGGCFFDTSIAPLGGSTDFTCACGPDEQAAGSCFVAPVSEGSPNQACLCLQSQAFRGANATCISAVQGLPPWAT